MLNCSRCFLLLFSILLFCAAGAQQVNVLASGRSTSLRGLSVVNDSVLWVSGSNGTVARSADAGKTFLWMQVPGHEHRDFRDIEAFSKDTALIMAIAEPAVILQTTDGGSHWHPVFTDSTPGMFLDAMAFADEHHGVVLGDPIGQKAFIAFTADGGDHWHPQEANMRQQDTLAHGEAFFAASGTNIKLLHRAGSMLLYVSGGARSRLFINHIPYDVPLIQGRELQGANSIATDSAVTMLVIVAGDYSNDTLSVGNAVVGAIDAALRGSFSRPVVPPHGYRSCVTWVQAEQFVTCGLTGIDLSEDGGQHWKLISTDGFNVCSKAKKGSTVYFAGKDGLIARLSFSRR